jgi:membrane fusion protein, multidrug efflux system
VTTVRKRLLILVPVILVPLLGWALAAWLIDARAAAAPAPSGGAPAIPVTAARAQTRDMPVYVRGIGTVQAFQTVTVKSRVDGEIVKVDFTEGQEVKAGDLLFQIDPRQYQDALALAQANQQKDEASLVNALTELKRDQALVAHSFQTQEAYDQQKATVGQLRASIKADAAQVALAQLNLGFTRIRSPIDGRTGARLVDVGNLVRASDNTGLVTIAQLRPIYVSFTAPENAFATIRASQARSPVPVEALAANDEKPIATGTLTLIDNQIDPASGTIHLKAKFANPAETLWPGEFVNLRLVVAVTRNAVTVPARTVQQGPEGPYLFVVNPDGTVSIRKVKLAQTENGLTVIAKGLAAGAEVVVDGQYRLEQGSRVRLLPPERGS